MWEMVTKFKDLNKLSGLFIALLMAINIVALASFIATSCILNVGNIIIANIVIAVILLVIYGIKKNLE